MFHCTLKQKHSCVLAMIPLLWLFLIKHYHCSLLLCSKYRAWEHAMHAQLQAAISLTILFSSQQQPSAISFNSLQPTRPPVAATPSFAIQEMTDSAFPLPAQAKTQSGVAKPRDQPVASHASTTHTGCSTQQSRPSTSTNPCADYSAAATAVVTRPAFTDLKTAVKATLTLVSPTRFKVLVQYETNLIELFKRMPTRAYGDLWSSSKGSLSLVLF